MILHKPQIGKKGPPPKWQRTDSQLLHKIASLIHFEKEIEWMRLIDLLSKLFRKGPLFAFPLTTFIFLFKIGPGLATKGDLYELLTLRGPRGRISRLVKSYQIGIQCQQRHLSLSLSLSLSPLCYWLH